MCIGRYISIRFPELTSASSWEDVGVVIDFKNVKELYTNKALSPRKGHFVIVPMGKAKDWMADRYDIAPQLLFLSW